MQNISDCLYCLRKVRSALASDEVAYVTRSRIGRLNLEIAQLVADTCCVPFLDRPERIEIPAGAPQNVRILGDHCNKLLDTSRSLVQPSEPLDDRWTRRKSELLDQIDAMEQQLHRMIAEQI